MSLLSVPKDWSLFSLSEKELFGPSGPAPLYFFASGVPSSPDFEGETLPYNSTSQFLSHCSNSWPAQPCCVLPNQWNGGDVEITTSRMLCECWGGQWKRYGTVKVDNIGDAVISLFSISTTEGWVNAMFQLVDSTGIDMQPIRDHNIYYIIPVIMFMFICGFLVLNMFVATVVSAYLKAAEQQRYSSSTSEGGASGLMTTEEQRQWLRVQDAYHIINENKSPNETGWLGSMYKSSTFQWITTGSVIGNAIILCMTFFGQSSLWDTVLSAMNCVFAAVFTFEAIVSIRVYGYRYFFSLINLIDFTVVSVTDIGIVMAYEGTISSSSLIFVGIGRLFRLIRLIRLLQFRTLSNFIRTLIRTIVVNP